MALALDSLDSESEAGSSNSTSTSTVKLIGAEGLTTAAIDKREAVGELELEDFLPGKDSQPKISLEPTIYLDQMKRYLDHLNELRRINNGDDTADSPGYALHMVRIPVSLLPGQRTSKGYGAEISVTIKPVLGEELLPTTFRDLVANDIEDRLALPLANAFNHMDFGGLVKGFNDAAKKKNRKDSEEALNGDQEPSTLPSSIAPEELPAQGEMPFPVSMVTHFQHQEDVEETKELSYEDTVRDVDSYLFPAGSGVSGTGGRRSRFSFPTQHLNQVYGRVGVGTVAVVAWNILKNKPVSKTPQPNDVVHLVDVRGFLKPEIDAAYEFLSLPENARLWTAFCTTELAQAIKRRDFEFLRELREYFYYSPEVSAPFDLQRWTTNSLAWAIIAESALLNERLKDEIREFASKKGVVFCHDPECVSFVGPNPHLEARELFNEYVRQRWPIQVFALDPVTQDQNVADMFSRRRELQLAMAISVARGNHECQRCD